MFKSYLHALRSTCVGLGIMLASTTAQADGLAGPYLAAVQASYQYDYVSAARYFSQAVARDNDNPYLLQNAVMNNVVAGQFDKAVPLANHLVTLEADKQIAGLVLVADAIADENFDTAADLLEDEKFGFNTLVLGLLKGWTAAGRGNVTQAQTYLDDLGGQTEFGPLGQYHKALILAMAGDFDGAIAIFEGNGEEPLRVSRASLIAHVQILVQLERTEDAIAVIDEAGTGPFDPELNALREKLAAGEYLPFDQVSSAKDGAAEVFLTLATALSREDAEVFALLYARLAQNIRPDYIDALLLSAEILEEQEQYDLAIRDYGRVPESSGVYRDAEIGRASALSRSGDVEGAIASMIDLLKAYPEDAYIHLSLGDTYRREERFQEASESYTRAIDLKPEASWRDFYVRGISYERLDQWDLAEADFRRALELEPDQALVLNYLGYSLVEKNMKIEEARDMIERAVAGDPDNGYITDSLGWVLYRIGKFEEAVPHMERAVELLPSDPVINDHLGDVLWMVGRKTEAQFQWKRALSFEPDEEANPDRIRRKLKIGLDEVLKEEKANGEN